MKRLMCLSLLLCLGAGFFAARGYSADIHVINLGPTSTAATDLQAAPTAPTASPKASVLWTSDGTDYTGALTAGTDTTLAIGSSVGTDLSSVSTVLGMGDILLTGISTLENAFAHLVVGGLAADAASPGTALGVFGGTSANFRAQFGTIHSQTSASADLSVAVLVGGKAAWVGIENLVGSKAMVQGSGTAEWGNTLKLDAITLTAAGELSATAISSKARLEIGFSGPTRTANTQLDYKATSAGENEGRIVFTNTGTTTLGGTDNKDVITFVDGNVAAVIETAGSLVLDDLVGAAADDSVAIAVADAGKGRFDVSGDFTVKLGGAAGLADVDAKGAATIGHKTASTNTAAALTLGDAFAANGVTINGSSDSAGVLTVNVKSMKSGAMGQATGTPGDPDYVAPAFTASTITVNGAASGVVLAGNSDAAVETIEASVINILGGTTTNNEIQNLTVAADLVVGTAESVGNLTVTASNLKNLTQQRGATTFSGAVAVDGMTTISGKDSVNNGTVAVSASSTFGAGITVNTGGVLQGAAGGIVLGRSATAASGTPGEAGYIAGRDAVTGELILNGGTIVGVDATATPTAAFSIRAVDASASTDGTLARMLVRGVGNTIDGGMVDASTLDLTMEFQKVL